jgi:hypothetical protein
MLENTQNSQRKTERGNVLFLILIAVALFAALSYAVTQSSRSGGGDAGNETNLISSAQITQYPSSVRTAIIRMMVSSNVSADQLQFNPPSDYASCTSTSRCVFHPSGGGATYVEAPENVVTGSSSQPWVFNGQNEVNLVGTTAAGANDSETATTVEIMAILPNVETSICNRINDELGIGPAAVAETGIDVTSKLGGGGSYVTALASGGSGGTIGNATTSTLNGQAFGCFSMGGVNYYYHVLIEQ